MKLYFGIRINASDMETTAIIIETLKLYLCIDIALKVKCNAVLKKAKKVAHIKIESAIAAG